MSQVKPVLQFNPDVKILSKNEKEVLEILIQAAKLVALVYSEQENHKLPGANFYPADITKDEIERAAKKDSQILDPYTVVERKGKELIAIPYHIKYRALLNPVAEKLIEASKITDNKEFAKRLQLQAKALLEGTYEEADINWLNSKPYVLDINIGPVERYDDKLFFAKTAYQAWVGVMDEVSTKRAKQFKDIILSARKQAAMSSEQVDFYDKVQIRVDDVFIFSGLISRTVFLGVNLPNDTKLMEKYGSEITIFKQANEYRVKNEVMPAFKSIFSAAFKKTFTAEDIQMGTLYSTILHELGHVYLRYSGSEARLKDLFPIIDELSAYVTGIKVGGYLLLKEVTTTKELESIMLAYLARSFEMALYERDNKSKYHYMLGGAIFINYLLENEAIQEKGGVSWPNFHKMFFSLGELGSILDKILASGNRSDAEAFIKKYGQIEKLQRFKR